MLFRSQMGRTNIENPRFVYNTEEELLANTPVSGRFTFGTDPYLARNYNLGFFVQDDWRFSRNLTFNLGLRYEYTSMFKVTSLFDDGLPHIFTAPILDDNFALGPFRDPMPTCDHVPAPGHLRTAAMRNGSRLLCETELEDGACVCQLFSGQGLEAICLSP